MKCKLKSNEFEAVQFFKDRELPRNVTEGTNHHFLGKWMLEDGDWIVYEDKKTILLNDREFHEKYEIIQDIKKDIK